MRSRNIENSNINANSSANDSINEFIDTDPVQQQEIQKMYLMFQKMATDPTLFKKMMGSVMSPTASEDSSQKQWASREREFQVEQHKYRNHEVSPRRSPRAANGVEAPAQRKETRKKGTDVLGDYLPSQKTERIQNEFLTESRFGNNQSSISEQQELPSTSHFVQHFDEIPIKTKYIEEKQRESPNYDLSYSRSDFNQSNLQKYHEAEERPITGIKGDFKAFVENIDGIAGGQQTNQLSSYLANNSKKLENKYEEPSEYPDQNQQARDKPAPNKQFLKRGSRQHLSSAKDKSVAKGKKPPVNKNLNISRDDVSEERPTRSISQNRVLGHRAKNPANTKSTTKRTQENNDQKSPKKTLPASSKPTQAQKIIPKYQPPSNNHPEEDRSPSPTFKVTQKQKPQAKKKNIFYDNSQSGSESDEHSQTQYNSKERTTQVIPGVLLTNKQLHQIISKYGPQNSESIQKDKAYNEKMSQVTELKQKYVQLCNALTEEKKELEEGKQKMRIELESHKQALEAKLKNERKVQERNMLATKKDKDSAKERQQLEALRKEVEKQREQYKKKDKNNRIIIEKYKKEIEDLKAKLNSSASGNNGGSASSNIYNPHPAQSHKKPASQVSKKSQSHSVNQEQSLDKQTTLPDYNSLKKKTPAVKYQYHEQKSQEAWKKEQKGPKRPAAKTNNYFQKDSSSQQPQDQQSGHSDQQLDHPAPEEEVEQIVEYNSSMKLSDLTKIPLTIKMVTEGMIENMLHYYSNPEYIRYKQIISQPRNKVHTTKNAIDRKSTSIFADGGKEVIFDTGVRKEYFTNGYSIIFFPNGDIKQKLSDETVLYFYSEKEVDQITLSDKTQIYRFDNNQVEFHYPDGRVEIRHPDGTFKVV